MNDDKYLEFFYNQIINRNLIEEITIKKVLKNNIVDYEDLKKETLSCEFYICKIELENKKILLIEDMPISFLLGHTILVGERTKLFEIENTKDLKKYICTEKILLDIQSNKFEDIQVKTKKEIKPRELYNKKYKLNFSQPQIIEYLKEYLSNIKKLDFEKIHVSNSSELEMFVPTLRYKHFKLAVKMNLPLVSLIKDNFINETPINIYDNLKIKDVVKPFQIYQKKQEIFLDKKTNLRLYNDIDYELRLRFNKDEIIEKINLAKTNFDKDKIINQIKKLQPIKISTKNGNLPLPIWKDVSNQKFLPIKNSLEFQELSGIKFNLEKETLQRLYLQTTSGKEAKYLNLFLNKNYEGILEKLNEDNIVEFENVNELVIQLISKNNIDVKNIVISENICENKKYILRNKIKKLIKKLILKSIENNHYPKQIEAKMLSEKYMLSSSNTILDYLEAYKKNLSKNELINNTNKKLENILNKIKFYELNVNDMYSLYLVILNSISVLSIYDEKNSIEIKQVLEAYFKEDSKDNKKDKYKDSNLEKKFEDILLLKKINKSKKVKVILKEDFDELKEFEKIKKNTEPKIFVKANKMKIKELFKYAYSEVILKIKKLNYYDITNKTTIEIKGKKLPLKNELYEFYEKYEGYKNVIENDWFVALIKE
ncbi:MAG: hypothetical protein PF569_03005 [Candidatus Woesearchaeota archaeon]|jgi:hypothetical protein|nr:hypothetical protein [Candidatus Woesearchaeota archaeon]